METLRRQEAAKRIGISIRALDKLIAAGALPVVRLGRRVLLLADDLDAFLAARRTTATVREVNEGGRP